MQKAFKNFYVKNQTVNTYSSNAGNAYLYEIIDVKNKNTIQIYSKMVDSETSYRRIILDFI